MRMRLKENEEKKKKDKENRRVNIAKIILNLVFKSVKVV